MNQQQAGRHEQEEFENPQLDPDAASARRYRPNGVETDQGDPHGANAQRHAAFLSKQHRSSKQQA